MDGDGSVEGEQDGGVQSIRKQRLTTASGKLFLVENLAYNDKVTGEQKVNESRKVVDVDGPKGEVDLRREDTFGEAEVGVQESLERQ
jgi:hypothetical protein